VRPALTTVHGRLGPAIPQSGAEPLPRRVAPQPSRDDRERHDRAEHQDEPGEVQHDRFEVEEAVEDRPDTVQSQERRHSPPARGGEAGDRAGDADRAHDDEQAVDDEGAVQMEAARNLPVDTDP
jgi:hypothetical protein